VTAVVSEILDLDDMHLSLFLGKIGKQYVAERKIPQITEWNLWL